jgi:hypothetical protein
MGRYKIWDKVEDIYTLGRDENGKSHFTPGEWLAKYPWAGIPGVKAIIWNGTINGQVMDDFASKVMYLQGLGMEITPEMTDEQILDAIEAFEDNPPGAGEPSVEERTAAALESLAMSSLPDAE